MENTVNRQRKGRPFIRALFTILTPLKPTATRFWERFGLCCALLHISELSNLVSRVFVNIYKLGANAYVPPAEPRQNYTTMKFTIVFAALALATGAAAQVDRQDAMRNLARSLIAEYEDFLEERAGGCQARSPQGTSGMECDPYNCDKYCVMGDKKCKWSERPKNCKKCTCTKA
ncbi:hypothetical protein BKA70DRAFT_1442627 [Coprinopsis sp. MPI-PUGE-AT-0042]|nr:hypothetical protein BKA70DRAFT_1442627 [Coprinopsis sp. MPI-PUGE-AT-0042]